MEKSEVTIVFVFFAGEFYTFHQYYKNLTPEVKVTRCWRKWPVTVQETCKIHVVAYSIIWSSLHSVCSVSWPQFQQLQNNLWVVFGIFSGIDCCSPLLFFEQWGTRRAEKKMAEFVLEADSRQRLQTAQLNFSKRIGKRFSAPSEFKGSVIHADRDHHDINQLGSQNMQKLWDTFVTCSLMWYFLKCRVYCFAFL